MYCHVIQEGTKNKSKLNHQYMININGEIIWQARITTSIVTMIGKWVIDVAMIDYREGFFRLASTNGLVVVCDLILLLLPPNTVSVSGFHSKTCSA